MKRIILIISVLLLSALFVFSGVCFAETDESADTRYQSSQAYQLTKYICENYPNRRAGLNTSVPPQNSVQEYLKGELANCGLTTKYKGFQIGDNTFGFNIEARLDKGYDKQIIIGAHYDSEGQGANDNAAGVAALLMIAQELTSKQDKLNCNVVFVLFDGEELGLYGSQNYVREMSSEERDNTLVMVNIDSIANGDNLYLWCENKRTGLSDLFIGQSNGAIAEKPYAKGTFNLRDVFGYGYYEFAQNSDHSSFRVQGIPIAFLFSGTYDLDPWHYAENSDVNKQVLNSSDDTFENLDKNNGAKFVEKIDAVVSTVIGTVLNGDFVSVAENQRSQLVNLNLWYNVWWPRLIVFVLFVVLVILAVFYYRKLQKKSILGTAEVKNNKVFETPEAEDIFTFK